MASKNKGDQVIAEMVATLKKIQANDPETLGQLASDPTSTLASMPSDERRATAIRVLTDSIAAAQLEQRNPQGHTYHSRDPLTGVIQSRIGEDSIAPELQGGGQGNPIVWLPAGVKGLLEHCRAKHGFIPATNQSRIEIPDKCKIALLGDWGFPNIHAQRLGDLAIAKGADYVIHLGDIYYSGSSEECKIFLERWPLRGAQDLPKKGFSFALNGNHEMYSLGFPYFDIVLPAFGQEASYFTLFNTHWQFQGLDTAYEPFSISGGVHDARLKAQYDWLKQSILDNKNKQNIFLSHNQPVSAHIPEFIAAQDLMNEARQLLEEVGGLAIYAWFFGHEHRCTIYDDKAKAALFRARLIGNGSIAHHPQEEVSAEKDEQNVATTGILKANHRSLDDDNEVAVSTFALLDIDGDRIHVDYIDEDDILFHSEDWITSDKLW